jgi:hypothetical protein
MTKEVKRYKCGDCDVLMEFKFDDYYLPHRGEIEVITDVPQHVCPNCRCVAVLNEDIAKMRRIIDHNIFYEEGKTDE